MTTYNSYEAAKIANPESDIYIYKSQHNESSFKAIDGAPTSQFANGWKLCHPANHCMTVEEFLKAGYKLYLGDIYLSINGVVCFCDANFPPSVLNNPNEHDNERYILRAKSLEEKPKTESDYEKGMREAMKKIAKSCGRSFCVDIGYEDLPDLVESLINTKAEEKPKRVKVEYVKVEESIFDVMEDYYSGRLFGDSLGEIKITTFAHLGACFDTGKVYRRVETPIEWWEDLVEYIEKATEDSGYAELTKGEKLHVEASMSRDKWCDFARILIEQEGEAVDNKSDINTASIRSKAVELVFNPTPWRDPLCGQRG